MSLSVEFRQVLSDGSGNPRNVTIYKPKSAAKAQTWPRSAPARLPCRVARHGERVAVSAWCGLDAHSVTAPNVTYAALMHVQRQHGVVQSIESQSARHVERVRYATRVRRDASLTATLACSGVTRVTRPGPL